MNPAIARLALMGILAVAEKNHPTLCVNCKQPRSFHKADECPHLDAAGAVERYGPETWSTAGTQR